MLAEKLRRERGNREALNPPSSFHFILCGQACMDGGGGGRRVVEGAVPVTMVG